MAFEDLTEFELRLLKWISASDFVEIPWSTKRAAEAFKVEERGLRGTGFSDCKGP